MLFNLFILILALAVANIQEILGSSGVSLAHYIFSLIYSLTISILGLVAGIGILVLKPWARKLLLSLALIVIPVGTANLIFTSVKYTDLSLIMGTTLGFIFGLVYYILVLWYFNKANVKKVFS